MAQTIATLTFTGHGPHELRVMRDGVLVTERLVSEMAGAGAWDRGLEALGFLRVGDWQPWDGGHGRCCRVSERSA